MIDVLDGFDAPVCRGAAEGQIDPVEEFEDAHLGGVGIGGAGNEYGEGETTENGLGEEGTISRVRGSVRCRRDRVRFSYGLL